MLSPKILLGTALVSLLCSACSRHHQVAGIPVPPPARSPSAAPAERPPAAHTGTIPGTPYTQVGYASWYGNPYHGRRAANGEIYDMHQMTAAHLTLPFGTQAKVTDLENNRTVMVRINDRGPFVNGRIIDLSLAAASAIQMIGPGTALVRLEVLSMPAEPDLGAFAVQIGAFRDRAAAEQLLKRVLRRYSDASIQTYDSPDGTEYRVRIGPKPSLSQARQLASQLERDSLSGFVVRVDN